MHIKIPERLRPFSHTPGVCVILPGTSLRLQIFPTLIRVYDLLSTTPQLKENISIPLKGPLKNFTVQLDLEQVDIKVFGEDLNGYFRYRIFAGKDHQSLAFKIEKGLSNCKIHSSNDRMIPPFIDRLSLGGHKSQDFDKLNYNCDLIEILPIWLRLGQLVEASKTVVYEGTAALLKKCQEDNKIEVYSSFINLFKTGFEGLLSPRLIDDQHQGFEFPVLTQSFSPLILLTEGSKIIRSLFFQQTGNDLFILPRLPPQFHCGRYLQIRCEDLGLLDIEWTKKTIRRMVFHAEKNAEIQFHFPKDVNRFRLEGEIHPVGSPVEFLGGQVYHFDNFQI